MKKNYQHPLSQKFWLIIYCTPKVPYITEYNNSKQSPALKIAKDYLKTDARIVFDEIWFLCFFPAEDLIKLWPLNKQEKRPA